MTAQDITTDETPETAAEAATVAPMSRHQTVTTAEAPEAAGVVDAAGKVVPLSRHQTVVTGDAAEAAEQDGEASDENIVPMSRHQTVAPVN